MTGPTLTLVPSDAPDSPETTRVAERLFFALRGRAVPLRRRLAQGEQATTAEGLALVQHFLAIKDAEVRQALLDATSALATAPV